MHPEVKKLVAASRALRQTECVKRVMDKPAHSRHEDAIGQPKVSNVQVENLPEPTDWSWTAITYQKRLENIAWFVAFAAYCASVYWLGSLLEYFRVDSVWTETIGMVVWLPLGFVAYSLKNWLEDWLVRVEAKR
jgi:hypothetical protein